MSGVREGLTRAAEHLKASGSPAPELRGKLLRPTAASAGMVPPEPESPFWFGALALEMVHEASLLHDDILDGASMRRARPTLDPGAALVRGDHLLTAAYGAAARSGVPGFLERFVAAVEATVAGEIRQARAAGRRSSPDEYREAIEGKSGELFGAALALGALWRGDDPDEARRVGRRLGALYQMVDDLLDYCPAAETGKPPLQDLRQGKWTFVLEVAGLDALPEADDPLSFALSLAEPRGGPSVLRRALERLEGEAVALTGALPGIDLSGLTGPWLEAAREALRVEEAARRAARTTSALLAPTAEAEVAEAARALGGPDRWPRYFARHSRSFRFASLLFPAHARRSVEGIYAFCRFTDDLVDEAEVPAGRARERLEAWRGLASEAYTEEGGTGIPLLDVVMSEAARSGVPFHYADELLTGVGMDLDPVRYPTLADLRVYSYRVASVVGGWLTEAFGVHTPSVLERAFALGHAMQLTNILRDVGEDWRRDRLYLPLDRVRAHGITDQDLVRLAAGEGPPEGEAWPALMEELMARADREYERAFEAMPALPRFYARPVAVAARIYQGIHDALRRNDYDNGGFRAHTTLRHKLVLGVRGLRDLRRARRLTSVSPHLLVHRDV